MRGSDELAEEVYAMSEKILADVYLLANQIVINLQNHIWH